MNKSEAIERVTAIRAIKNDDEAAHSAEDALYRDALKAISEGKCAEPVGVARVVLGTQRMKFARHCA